MLRVILSGGQTGADRAALDFAISNGIPHGGWCPKGRLAEDGIIPAQYKLTETKSDKYPPRTEMNIKHSDGTIIFNHSERLERGCALTLSLCEKHAKHVVVLGKREDFMQLDARIIEHFIFKHYIQRLNIAGNRESKAPGIHDYVFKILNMVSKERFAIVPSIVKKLQES